MGMWPESYFCLREKTLQPSEEWRCLCPGWCGCHLPDGFGYWMAPGLLREVNAADVWLVFPRQDGVLRSSRLGPLRLQYFQFSHELLGGLLTLGERQILDRLAANVEVGPRFLSAGHTVARQFARLLRQPDKPALLRRCQMLQIACSFFASDLSSLSPPGKAVLPAGLRLKNLMNELPEREILNYSRADLSSRCGCHPSYFSRLFSQIFGVSFRAAQGDARLGKAQEMLLQSDRNVWDIARECGFRDRRHFNAVFKKRCGMTPSEWRTDQRTPVNAAQNSSSIAATEDGGPALRMIQGGLNK